MLKPLHVTFRIEMYSAGALLLVPVTATSFLLHNTFVFKERLADAVN